MAAEDPVPPRADGARRTDVVVLLQRDDLAADDPRGGEPARDRERDHHRPEVVLADDRQDDDRKRQVRQPVERVEEAHLHVVDQPTREAGDRSVDDADEEDCERRSDTDRDRDSPAERELRQQVLAELVGPEGVLHRRPVPGLREVHRVAPDVVWRDPRPDQAEEREEEEDRAGNDGALVLDVAAPRIPPEVRLGHRRAGPRAGAGDVGGGGAGGDGFARIDDAHVRASLVRGSRIPYRMSTIRLAITITTDVRTVIPMTTE